MDRSLSLSLSFFGSLANTGAAILLASLVLDSQLFEQLARRARFGRLVVSRSH